MELMGIPVWESVAVPEGSVFLLGKHGQAIVTHNIVALTRDLQWLERCPVLSMGAESWAEYLQDRRPLTPGEWLATKREEAASTVRAALEEQMRAFERLFLGEPKGERG